VTASQSSEHLKHWFVSDALLMQRLKKRQNYRQAQRRSSSDILIKGVNHWATLSCYCISDSVSVYSVRTHDRRARLTRGMQLCVSRNALVAGRRSRVYRFEDIPRANDWKVAAERAMEDSDA